MWWSLILALKRLDMLLSKLFGITCIKRMTAAVALFSIVDIFHFNLMKVNAVKPIPYTEKDE